jgi:signal transduction histidine kinase
MLLVVFVITIVLLYKKKQLLYLNELKNAKTLFESNLLATQIEIQEETFQYISREIHDNISLSLTLAKLNLNIINWNSLQEAKIKLNTSLMLITKAIEDLSNVSKSLNSELIITAGLKAALENEIQVIAKMNLFKIRLQISGTPIFLDSQMELVIFRIIQESLNNIVKHARASSVELSLHYSATSVTTIIHDNGKGFHFKAANACITEKFSSGLLNMRKRTALFKGELNIESSESAGTKILLIIPYK